MLTMILKMSGVTALCVLLTVVVWKRIQGKKMTVPLRLAIGLIYGIFSILSTHFGVDYSHMMLNVRDMGPLTAGLFFDPISGIIAGLIGGIERYIAGTYWGVGSYTRIACSVSTCLAGFVAAVMHIFLFKRKKPSAVYAFFVGAVMEVFHMYVVFITHRDDMSMAFYVVRNCAPPMIIFTALGMGAVSAALMICSGEWVNPFHKRKNEEVPVSHRFQVWLFAVTTSVLVLNLLFSFAMQTQTAEQNARETLTAVTGDIRATYEKLRQTYDSAETLAGETARRNALTIAEAIERSEGSLAADEAFLAKVREDNGLVSVTIVDRVGNAVARAGSSPVYDSMLSDVMDGKVESQAVNFSDILVIAGARCGDGMVQVILDKDSMASMLKLEELDETLSYFHVGSTGFFDVFEESGLIVAGDHEGSFLGMEERKKLNDQPEDACFVTELRGVSALCQLEQLDSGLKVLTALPMTEIYNDRDVQTYESAFAAIVLFAVVYALISMLVQSIVVNNLQMVNESLNRITHGNLNEVVSVRESSEFASLSDDINQTVEVLKGYIKAAEKRIEQELILAWNIQDSALPKNFTFPRDEFELYALMDPAKEVGGDFYDFFFVGPHRLALVIADVSGKGIPASLFMMRSKTAIRSQAESGQSPAEILRRANNTLCEGNDAEMFVTVWLGIIDLSTGKMLCANAGHEYPVLMRAGGDYEYVKDKHGLALAILEDRSYKEYELQMNPGDRLFVYTDGVPEAINLQEEQYGPERLTQVLNTVKDASMEVTLTTARKDVSDFAGQADQFDDITMLGFELKHLREE